MKTHRELEDELKANRAEILMDWLSVLVDFFLVTVCSFGVVFLLIILSEIASKP